MKKARPPLEYYERLSYAKPGWTQQMREITDKYVELVYKKVDQQKNPEVVKEFRSKIRQFHMMLY